MSAMLSILGLRARHAVARAGWGGLLWVACSGGAQADTFIEAFEAARQTLGTSTWSVQLEVVSDRSITVAVSAAYRNGACRVILLDSSAYVADTLRMLDDELRRPYLEALFAHELGHCEDMHSAHMTPDVTAGGTSLNVVTPVRRIEGDPALETPARRVLRAEILADATAALYLAERHPELADMLVAFHLGRRAQRSEQDPDHDTSRCLAGRDLVRRGDEDIHGAAQRIRRECADDGTALRDSEGRASTR
ncbi:MAG: hypothetical protein U1F52_03055 [Burkholderiales bacterium]